ncbi:acetyl-CoA carboxylase biotin carboxyl carrier protein subunit [Peredibacter starrii]|uniref:Acetyl-CoA carboxylase biotin carboxyl carrier protein subunit n=1 Tax=Peredibacter starrii TaxID=28202 RepID=A0AAX4HPP5_9BACT|nr:acetyl-CoA carboxylase biotin carboxyl carrier protein subunit [Peredibacter starrii]WPU65216.1 acetyl-CoA carboxylase biotin carboxyl carrier protein subunit [Peredibacter starrii]
MRYYFMNQDMKEFALDVEIHPGKVMEFTVDGAKTKLLIKNLAGKNFYSFDGVAWKKLAALGVNEVLVSNSEVYKVFRGFKPSGLNKGGAGALITQMPGKVVKLMKKEGDKVTKGETVLILEAMKMENEIKSGADGTIKAINVKEGQALEAGFLMVEIDDGTN